MSHTRHGRGAELEEHASGSDARRAAALCERLLCLWRPGEPQPGLTCVYTYTGRVPCTGPRVCITCGGRATEAS